MKFEPAKGKKGFLIWCGGDRYVFRIYGKYREFVDYDLRHSDCEIIINDDDGYLYTDPRGNSLDHSPETLGLKNNIITGADINAGDGGYRLGTQEGYDEFVKQRNNDQN